MKKDNSENLTGANAMLTAITQGAAVREPTREYKQQCSCCGGSKNVKNYSCIICRNWLKAKT